MEQHRSRHLPFGSAARYLRAMAEREDDSSYETWTEEDDAAVAFESLPAWHPSLFFEVFRTGMQNFGDHAAEIALGGFVTPESEWGDFSEARAIANSQLKTSMTALWALGAPDVSYVRLVDTDAWIATNAHEIPAAAHATLVWRPELAVVPGSSWRLHAIGEPISPDRVPRTAPGFDPRKLS